MRGRRLTTLLAVLTTLVLGAGTSAAVPAGLGVTPGGRFTGAGGPVGAPAMCAGSTIAGQFTASGNPLGTVDKLAYHGCAMGTATATIPLFSPWQLTGVSHANGVTGININRIAATISWPGCVFTVAGSASASYDNATSILTVHVQNITVTSVSNCLGLISAGQYVSILSGSYTISPPQVIHLTGAHQG